MNRSAVLDQPALWDVPRPAPARPTTAAAKHRPTHAPRPRRSKEAQAEECDPACLACGKPEGRGLCYPRCSVVCVHTGQPDVVEVCLTTTRVVARLVAGVPGVPGVPGRRLAVVECPFCERLHWHTPAFGRHHRVSGCGQPYIVTLPRPRITPQGAPRSTQTGEQGVAGQEGHASTFNASQAATATRGAAAARAALTTPGPNKPPYNVQADTSENTQ